MDCLRQITVKIVPSQFALHLLPALSQPDTVEYPKTASFAVQSPKTPPYSTELPKTFPRSITEAPKTLPQDSPNTGSCSRESPKTPTQPTKCAETLPTFVGSPKTAARTTTCQKITNFAMESPGTASYFMESPTGPLPLLEKKVTLFYGSHYLRGTLYLLPDTQFMGLHSRFFDILPTLSPKLDDEHCLPWVLMHSVLGNTWVDRSQLPGRPTELEDTKHPTFIALTDSAFFFQSASVLGQCDWEGKLSSTRNSNDLIIALQSDHAFCGTRYFAPRDKSTPTKLGLRAVPVIDYPPRAVPPQVLELTERIQRACEEFQYTTDFGVPKKWWIKENLDGHLDARGMLVPTSPLYAHRGNEALFKRKAWQTLCFLAGRKNDNTVAKGESALPAAYCQTLFADLQARERVDGTVMLRGVDVKWYEMENEQQSEEGNAMEVD